MSRNLEANCQIFRKLTIHDKVDEVMEFKCDQMESNLKILYIVCGKLCSDSHPSRILLIAIKSAYCDFERNIILSQIDDFEKETQMWLNAMKRLLFYVPMAHPQSCNACILECSFPI